MYNRWLTTLGGGEQYSLTIAQLLGRKHDVHVISHQPVSQGEVSRRLNLDLSNVHLDVIPSRSAVELTPLTGEYDLFLNVSYMDFIPSVARRSASVIFFPAAFEGEKNARLRYRLGWSIKKWFMVPTLSQGFLRFQNGSIRSQSIETSSPVHLQLPPSRVSYKVSFDLYSNHPAVKQAGVILDGILVETVPLKTNGEFQRVFIDVPVTFNRLHNLVIRSSEPAASPAGSEFVLSQVVVHTPRFKTFQTFFGSVFGRYGVRFQLLPLPFNHSTIHEAIDTYDAIWAISKFTQRWIKTYWQRESILLYPPVDVEKFSPAPKKNQILSVGRFFAGSHNKKHLEMVKAFKEMVDGGLKDWELHLVGGSTPGDIHQDYLENVKSEAAHYPIFIHPDLPHLDMLKLYNESAIYWHASGYGEDETRDPVKFEHFGITTVEGMAAGCVPVVIGKGGQPEIVSHGRNGYLWNSPEQLITYTLRLIRDPGLREKISAISLADSAAYSKMKFQDRLDELLNDIGIEL